MLFIKRDNTDFGEHNRQESDIDLFSRVIGQKYR